MGGYLGVFLILLGAGLIWLLKPGESASAGVKPPAGVDDRAALEAAEAELAGETAPDATPEDAEEDLKDWGPGAAKP
jgi:hypothetical protein